MSQPAWPAAPRDTATPVCASCSVSWVVGHSHFSLAIIPSGAVAGLPCLRGLSCRRGWVWGMTWLFAVHQRLVLLMRGPSSKGVPHG